MDGLRLICTGQHLVEGNVREADMKGAKLPSLSYLRGVYGASFKDPFSFSQLLITWLMPFLNFLTGRVHIPIAREAMFPTMAHLNNEARVLHIALEVLNERRAWAINAILNSKNTMTVWKSRS